MPHCWDINYRLYNFRWPRTGKLGDNRKAEIESRKYGERWKPEAALFSQHMLWKEKKIGLTLGVIISTGPSCLGLWKGRPLGQKCGYSLGTLMENRASCVKHLRSLALSLQTLSKGKKKNYKCRACFWAYWIPWRTPSTSSGFCSGLESLLQLLTRT